MPRARGEKKEKKGWVAKRAESRTAQWTIERDLDSESRGARPACDHEYQLGQAEELVVGLKNKGIPAIWSSLSLSIDYRYRADPLRSATCQ